MPTTGVAVGRPASSTTAEIYMQAQEHTEISTALYPLKVWKQFVDDVFLYHSWTYALGKCFPSQQCLPKH